MRNTPTPSVANQNESQLEGNLLDSVILVDEQDTQIGTMDKIEAHRGDGKRHRAISVFLYDNQDRLFIQKRSTLKIVGAEQWGNTACGNLRPGESYEDCATRRLREELGIQGLSLEPGEKFEYHIRCNDQFSEWEIDQLFYSKIGDATELQYECNPDEASEARWISLEELHQNIDQDSSQFAPWFLLMIERKLHLPA
mgnify:CR=1 FL=1